MDSGSSLVGWGQGLENLGDIVAADVEVGREADPALAGGGGDFVEFEVADEHFAFDSGMAKTNYAGTGGGRAFEHDFVALGTQAFVELSGALHNGGLDVFDACFEKEFERSALAEAADGVEGAAFIAAGVGAEGHIAGTVIGKVGGIGPAEFDGFDGVEAAVTDVKDAIAFRAEHPFVAVGGERVDVGGFDVDGEDAHALNGVDEEEAAVLVAELANGIEIDTVAAEIVDEADGEQACAGYGGGDGFEGVVNGEPGELDTAFFEEKPGIVVGGEFFLEGDDAVAGLPMEAEGDDGDAFGSVFDDGNFGGARVDEAGSGLAEAGLGIEPFVVMEGAELAGVVGKPAHGVGGAAR